MELGGYKEDELWDAVSNRNVEEVKRSLAKGADATCIAPDGWVRSEASGKGGRSILHHAAYVGDLDVFRALVEDGGADMMKRRQRNWASFRGNTPFHQAAFYGRQAIVEWCIATGADVNMQGEQGYTCLHLAAKYGYPRMVEYLLASGARTDMITKEEKRAVDMAKTEEIKEMLLRHDNASVRMHKNLPTLPQAASSTYLQQGWDKGDTDTFRKPDLARAPAPAGMPVAMPLGHFKDPTATDDNLRGRSARFLKSRQRDDDAVDMIGPGIGKENVNRGRDRMMPNVQPDAGAGAAGVRQMNHGRRGQQQQQQEWPVNAFPRPQHHVQAQQARQQETERMIGEMQGAMTTTNSRNPGIRMPQQHHQQQHYQDQQPPMARQGWEQQQSGYGGGPNAYAGQPPQQFQQGGGGYRQQQQQQQQQPPRGGGGGAYGMSEDEMIMTGGGDPSREWASSGGGGYNGGGGGGMSMSMGGAGAGGGGGYDDAADAHLAPPKKTGFEDMSDDELIRRLERLRADKSEAIAAVSSGMARGDADKEATENGTYGGGGAPPSHGGARGGYIDRQPIIDRNGEVVRAPYGASYGDQTTDGGVPSTRMTGGKDVSSLNADMEAFVAEKMRAASATGKDAVGGGYGYQEGRRHHEVRGPPQGSTEYEEAVVKERKALMALADTKRKISSFHAQNTARSVMSSAGSMGGGGGDFAGMPPAAGLVGERRAGRGKAVDPESGESFYSSAKTSGNILMHDAMYTSHQKGKAAAGGALLSGQVHPSLKSTRPW